MGAPARFMIRQDGAPARMVGLQGSQVTITLLLRDLPGARTRTLGVMSRAHDLVVMRALAIVGYVSPCVQRSLTISAATTLARATLSLLERASFCSRPGVR